MGARRRLTAMIVMLGLAGGTMLASTESSPFSNVLCDPIANLQDFLCGTHNCSTSLNVTGQDSDTIMTLASAQQQARLNKDNAKPSMVHVQ